MIVIDASAIVEAMVGAAPSGLLLECVAGEIFAPDHIDVEVTSVLRRLERGGVISTQRAERAMNDFLGLAIQRQALAPLAGRVWTLRHQFTPYDAASIVLAEVLEAPLVTCDRKLLSDSHRANVILATQSV